MYYRVAFQVELALTWQWKSTVLSSLGTLFQFLRLYRALPQDHLRVFSSASREDLEKQLVQNNNGLASISVTAAQFLNERMIGSREMTRGVSERREQGTQGNQRTTSIAVSDSLNGNNEEAHTLDERGMNSLERRRMELEGGAGGDHDSPYIFTLPTLMPQALSWMKLLVRVQEGALQP